MSNEINKPIRKGTGITASLFEAIRQVAARFAKFSVSYPLEMTETNGGPNLRIRLREECWVKITSGGSGAKYAWTEQIPTASGGWSNGPRSGTTTTNPAYEVNGSTVVPANSRVWATRDETSKAWRFILSKCS